MSERHLALKGREYTSATSVAIGQATHSSHHAVTNTTDVDETRAIQIVDAV